MKPNQQWYIRTRKYILFFKLKKENKNVGNAEPGWQSKRDSGHHFKVNIRAQ